MLPQGSETCRLLRRQARCPAQRDPRQRTKEALGFLHPRQHPVFQLALHIGTLTYHGLHHCPRTLSYPRKKPLLPLLVVAPDCNAGIRDAEKVADG